MKNLKWLSLLGMVCFGLFTFVACGDEEEEGPGGGTTDSELATKILGDWYFVEEQSSERINVCWMSFQKGGKGKYGEVKAKAKDNWQPRPQTIDIDWALSGNHLTMTGEVNGQTLTREGDVKVNGDGTLTVTRYLDDGSKDNVTVRKMSGKTAEGILAALLRGEDPEDQPGQDISQWAQMIVGCWYTTYADVSYTDSMGNELTFKGEVKYDKESSWPFFNIFEFGKDGDFNGWSINYNGSGNLYGRIEQTHLGKYSFDPETKVALLYELVMGYHEVLAFKAGQEVEMMEMPVTILNLTENELEYTVEGLGTYRMAKADESIIPDDDEPTPENPDSVLAEELLGTWKTVRIAGSATDVETGEVVESWDNYPTLEEAQDPDKESLKYMEFTFGQNGMFMMQMFNEETREFSEIMQGEWMLDGNYLRAFIGDFVKEMEIKLDEKGLRMHESRIEEGFRAHPSGKEYTVRYDETIYCTRK